MKGRPKVTRDGNSSSGNVEYVDLPLALTRQFGCIMWQPVRLLSKPHDAFVNGIFFVPLKSQCVACPQIFHPRAESTWQNCTCSIMVRESRVETEDQSAQTGEKVDRKKVRQNGRPFDSSESSVLSFDFIT